MINNYSVSLPKSPQFQSKNNKQLKDDKVEQVTNPQYEEDAADEEYTFESTANALKKEDAQFRNSIIKNTIMALGLTAAIGGYALSDESNDYIPPTSHCVVLTDADKALLAKADSLSKEGKDSTVLEAKEFHKLLDMSKMDDIPRLTQANMRCLSTASYTPVNMNDIKANERILKQVQTAQHYLDKLAESYRNNPPKSSMQNYYEYAMENITDREIMEHVDFSELELYQRDITVLKHLINCSRERIKRNDPHAEEKKQKAIADAQRQVDNIVHKYQMRAKVSGNYNGDETLTKGELASLLNLKSLEEFPPELQMRIIAKALENYKPRSIAQNIDNRQLEITNRLVDEDRERAQRELDLWAFKAQKEFYQLLHPNTIQRGPLE